MFHKEYVGVYISVCNSVCVCVQERVDELRAALSEGKLAVASLTDRVQTLQSELTLSQQRREELETELNNTQEVCVWL